MARRQVSIFINGNAVENSIKAITRQKRLLSSELRKLVRGTDEYNKKAAELKKVNRIITEHNAKIRDLRTSWDKIAGGSITKIAGIAASAFAVDKIVDYGRELFKLGTEMELLERKAQTIFKEALPGVTRAAQENAAAMGITTDQYVDAAAKIGDLLIPMEFFPKEAADMSTSLVDLSGALAEWTGGQIDAENVARILSKAVLGEREELKQLGISILESDVKARLAEKGLKNLTGTMLQQAKAVATLELITEKSVDAQAAFAANSDLSARKQAELTARLREVQAVIAQRLVPVFQRLIKAAEPFISLIEDFVAIPLSETLQEERNELNLLVGQITDANISQADRNKLIGQLQTQYPTFLKNLDAETATNDQLADRLREVNDQYIFKIALQKEDEKIQKAASELADQQRSLAEKDVELQRKLIKVNDDYKLGLDLTNKSLQERLDLTQDALRSLDTGGSDVLAQTFNTVAAGLERSGRAAIEARVDARSEELIQLQQYREELKKNLAAELGINVAALEEETSGTGTGLSPTPEERAAQAAAAEKLRKQREDQAKQALKDRQRQLEELAEALQGFEDEQILARLSDDDRALEQVRRRYQKEIDVALALERQGVRSATAAKVELIKLRDQELLALSIAQGQAQFDAEEAQALELEELRKQREQETAAARFAAQQEIREVTQEVLLGEQELALLQLGEQYDRLTDLARQHGLDTVDIEKAFALEKERVRKEFSEKTIKATAAESQALAENYAKSYASISSLIGGAIQLVGDESKEAVALQKILTLAQIGFNSAAAISAATAAGAAAGPFPANLAAIATGVATVLGNIAQARSVIAEVPQFFDGGYVKAKGATDGRTYNARYIGQPSTGMLPNSPILADTSIGPVLASERGREYFVSNTAMRNPQVLNYVRAIDNITKYRQFMDGGATTPLPSGGQISSSGDLDTAQLTAATTTLTAAIGRLNEILSSPLYAVIDDDSVIDLRNKTNELITASGGVL